MVSHLTAYSAIQVELCLELHQPSLLLIAKLRLWTLYGYCTTCVPRGKLRNTYKYWFMEDMFPKASTRVTRPALPSSFSVNIQSSPVRLSCPIFRLALAKCCNTCPDGEGKKIPTQALKMSRLGNQNYTVQARNFFSSRGILVPMDVVFAYPETSPKLHTQKSNT